AFAEALRVVTFWKLVGIGASADVSGDHPSVVGQSIADAYPIRQPSEVDWIKNSIRWLDLIDAVAPRSRLPLPFQHGHFLARNCWLAGQFRYFRRRSDLNNRRAEAFETRSAMLVLLSVLLAAVLFVMEIRHSLHHADMLHRIAIFT